MPEMKKLLSYVLSKTLLKSSQLIFWFSCTQFFQVSKPALSSLSGLSDKFCSIWKSLLTFFLLIIQNNKRCRFSRGQKFLFLNHFWSIRAMKRSKEQPQNANRSSITEALLKYELSGAVHTIVDRTAIVSLNRIQMLVEGGSISFDSLFKNNEFHAWLYNATVLEICGRLQWELPYYFHSIWKPDSRVAYRICSQDISLGLLIESIHWTLLWSTIPRATINKTDFAGRLWSSPAALTSLYSVDVPNPKSAWTVGIVVLRQKYLICCMKWEGRRFDLLASKDPEIWGSSPSGKEEKAYDRKRL